MPGINVHIEKMTGSTISVIRAYGVGAPES